MNNNISIKDWAKYEFYPSLFEVIDKVLPEFKFKKFGNNWISYYRCNLKEEKDFLRSKVYVWAESPAYLRDANRESISIIEYIMKRDGLGYAKAVDFLSSKAGIEPNFFFKQNGEASDLNIVNAKQAILEACMRHFYLWLYESEEGEEIVGNYLKEKGFKLGELPPNFEIGFIPSQEKLFKFLIDNKGFDPFLVRETLKLSKEIGDSHCLAIAFRSGGVIKGFVFRTLRDHSAKSLNSMGLDNTAGFFNLNGVKGDKDVVIVDGELDCLNATAHGIENVVATGGHPISHEQIRDAVRLGAKSFTLCFDFISHERAKTSNRIEAAIRVILKEGINRVYIANIPEYGGYKSDPNRVIKGPGIERLEEIINSALPYYEYWFQKIVFKFADIDSARDLTSREVDDFLDEVIETSLRISNPTDNERYINLFVSLRQIKDLEISYKSIGLAAERMTFARDAHAKEKDLKRLLLKATELQEKGEIDKALELLEDRVKKVILKDKAKAYKEFQWGATQKEVMQRYFKQPRSIYTGYKIGGTELILPSRAISVISAPTSHGKTAFLINMALRAAENNPNKAIYFFSYEEDRDTMLFKALNTFMDTNLGTCNLANIRNYINLGMTYLKGEKKEYLRSKTKEFFKNLIETKRLNIHYSTYDSDTLVDAIKHLNNNVSVGAVFIDYIQLLSLPKVKNRLISRQDEVNEICKTLKDLAVETGLPIILGAQLNGTVTNHLHLNSNMIVGSGDMERIANLVLGFWNNNQKIKGSEVELEEIKKKKIFQPNTIYAEILKNRGGKVGLFELLEFNGNEGTIKNRKLSVDEPII